MKEILNRKLMVKNKTLLKLSPQNTNIKKQILVYLMLDGKKHKCYQIFNKSIKLIQKNMKKSSKEIIKLSIINSLPVIYTKKLIKKRGKQKFLQEIPFILSKNQRIKFSIKYILLALKKKASSRIYRMLHLEFLFNSKTFLQKKKDVLNRECLVAKKYTKFRWFL